MASLTTTSQLPAPVQQSFDYKLLAVPVPDMIHNVAATRKMMPRNGGNTLRMRRYNPLEAALVPLGNSGTTPPGQLLSAVDIDAKIDFYGTYIYLNEQVTLQNQDPVLNEGVQRLSVALRETEDKLTRNMLKATASSVNCTGGINGQIPTEISRVDIDGIVRALKNANAKTISRVIDGKNKFGTAPVRDAFWGMCSTNLIGDLGRIEGWKDISQYPNQGPVLEAEWGSAGNVRFLVSSIGAVEESASSTGEDVYDIFITGMDAYAVIEQDGYSASFIYRPPIYDGPLAQNASAGFKFGQVPRLTNDQWCIKLRASLLT